VANASDRSTEGRDGIAISIADVSETGITQRTFNDFLGLVWLIPIRRDVLRESYAGLDFARQDVDFVEELRARSGAG
jgi:hypothetical protein